MEKKSTRSISLTSENLRRLQDESQPENPDDTIRVDYKAKKWLAQNLNIDLERATSLRSTVGARSFVTRKSRITDTDRVPNQELFDSMTNRILE
jgi:hypothetical protein